MPRRIAPSTLLAVALLLCAPRAIAQVKTFHVDQLSIAGAPDDGVGVFRPQMPPSSVYGQFAMSYAKNPLRAENITDENPNALQGPPVALQINTYLTLGTGILERGAIQVTLPVTILQRGYATDNATAGLPQAVNLVTKGIGDLRIDGRVVLAENATRSFKLAARAAVFLPIGNEHSFMGDIGPACNLALASEFEIHQLFVTINAGASIRPKVTLADLTVGSEFNYAMAAYVPMAHGRVRFGLEVFGSLGLLPETMGHLTSSPLEWLLHSRVALNSKRSVWLGGGAGTRITSGYAPDFRGIAWLGGLFDWNAKRSHAKPTAEPIAIAAKSDPDNDKDGISDFVDGCPADSEDGIHPDDGCPEPPDADNDGVIGAADTCPEKPEDRDGIDDNDGCPEVDPEKDMDKDGIVDSADNCPREPGVFSDDPARNGCLQFIRVHRDKVELVQEIEFEFGRAQIVQKSFAIIDEIAGLLRANPEIRLLRIEGHTDNVGEVEHNLRLSKARADAVRDALVKRGSIDASRLRSNGFGSQKPLTTNVTEEGRAKNRRVEIHIADQEKLAP